jgi:glycerol-3-phosphate acyltransferase PlsY
MSALSWILVLLGAYLLGGISFSYVAGRLARGADLRRLGSGNLGATNVIRQIGWSWGLAVLALDLAKGYVAVAAAERILGAGPGPLLAGLAAILGHSFTPYLGFKGGKGVATSAGVFLRLAPGATGLALAVFLAVLLSFRMVSVASLMAALSLPLAVLLLREGDELLLALTLLAALLIWIRHRSNIARILRGEEPRFHLSRQGGD